MNRKTIILLTLLIAANIGAWVIFMPKKDSSVSTEDLSRFPHLSRRVLVDNPNDTIINFVSLRKSLKAKLDKVQGQKSLYFEYLPSGTSIGIGDDNDLVAASLLKLPMVMNLYKAAELGRIDLDSTVTLQASDIDSDYGSLWKMGVGYKLTLRKAASLILTDSDNTATRAVFSKLKGILKEDEQSMSQLDIEQKLQNGQAVINAKSYSSILRSLYLSSYLSKSNSEELLDSLTKSKETRRLTRDLPNSVSVAHKNGVYNSSWSESDCGIVYAPKRPYMLCIMVGLPDEQANDLIASISKEVYEYISRQN